MYIADDIFDIFEQNAYLQRGWNEMYNDAAPRFFFTFFPLCPQFPKISKSKGHPLLTHHLNDFGIPMNFKF